MLGFSWGLARHPLIDSLLKKPRPRSKPSMPCTVSVYQSKVDAAFPEAKGNSVDWRIPSGWPLSLSPTFPLSMPPKGGFIHDLNLSAWPSPSIKKESCRDREAKPLVLRPAPRHDTHTTLSKVDEECDAGVLLNTQTAQQSPSFNNPSPERSTATELAHSRSLPPLNLLCCRRAQAKGLPEVTRASPAFLIRKVWK